VPSRHPALSDFDQGFYDRILGLIDERSRSRAMFANLGYLGPGPEPARLSELPAWFPRKDGVWLLLKTLEGLDVRGRVIDVSCGLGGSLWCLRRWGFSAIGCDLSGKAARVSASRGTVARSDVGSIPLKGASVELVLSVEAAHAYPSWASFADECARCLRPGGFVAVADIATAAEHDHLRDELARQFVAVHDADITVGVLAARRAAAQQIAPLGLDADELGWVGDAAALPDSPMFAAMVNGDLQYRVLQCRLR
jgi:SAM-dependent methyltransferase